MNIEQRLKETRTRLQGTAERLNKLEQEKQSLLQEMLRLDGEVRVLVELLKEKETIGG